MRVIMPMGVNTGLDGNLTGASHLSRKATEVASPVEPMTSPVTGFVTGFVLALSARLESCVGPGLSSNQKDVGLTHNSRATVAQAGTSCLSCCYFSIQGP